MLINASFNSGDFYLDTVSGLCEGTTYEFAAWAINVQRPDQCNFAGIRPNVIFTIESVTGAILGSYKTENIEPTSSPTWKQYGLFFTAPAAGRVVMRISNIGPGGCGNDLAIDDISFRPCGPTVSASAVGFSTPNVNICETDLKPVTMNAVISAGYNKPEYFWQLSRNNGNTWTNLPGVNQSSIVHPVSVAGQYQYRLLVAEEGNISSPNCRISSNVISVTVHPPPGDSATSNSPVCEQGILQLNQFGGAKFAWQGPNNFTSQARNPQLTATPAAAGLYRVVISDDFGCTASDSVLVSILPKPNISLPPTYTTCAGKGILLEATSDGDTYKWTPNGSLSDDDIANPMASPADTTIYTLVVQNAAGCADTAKTTVNTLLLPTVNAGPDKVIFEGQSVQLDGSVTGGNLSWQWVPEIYMQNNQSLTPLVSPILDITYTLTVNSNNGCGSASDEVFVRVFNKIIIPTAISPNGDGINDTWRIPALQTYPNSKTTVFNRYGQQVFLSTPGYREWDGQLNGKPLPIGLYYYVIEPDRNVPVLKGSIMIVR